MRGICSESTKSHSLEEEMFIRMNSAQNEKRSLINTRLVFLNVFMIRSFRVSFFFFLKECDRV